MPALFAFTQLELAWTLGPPDGRYLIRRGALRGAAADDTPSHVVVLASCEEVAPAPRMRLRRGSSSEPGAAAPVQRATIVDVAEPLTAQAAADWLKRAGEPELERDLAVLNALLYAHRLAAGDPQVTALARRQVLAARLGFGAGEEVADGRFSDVRELPWQAPRRPRRRMLSPEGRLAAILTGRERPLVCEELTLRARADLDGGRGRHAALQLLVALDAAIAEMAADPGLTERVAELRGFREPVGTAAQAALAAEPGEADAAAIADALARLEAALRARAAARR